MTDEERDDKIERLIHISERTMAHLDRLIDIVGRLVERELRRAEARTDKNEQAH